MRLLSGRKKGYINDGVAAAINLHNSGYTQRQGNFNDAFGLGESFYNRGQDSQNQAQARQITQDEFVGMVSPEVAIKYNPFYDPKTGNVINNVDLMAIAQKAENTANYNAGGTVSNIINSIMGTEGYENTDVEEMYQNLVDNGYGIIADTIRNMNKQQVEEYITTGQAGNDISRIKQEAGSIYPAAYQARNAKLLSDPKLMAQYGDTFMPQYSGIPTASVIDRNQKNGAGTRKNGNRAIQQG